MQDKSERQDDERRGEDTTRRQQTDLGTVPNKLLWAVARNNNIEREGGRRVRRDEGAEAEEDEDAQTPCGLCKTARIKRQAGTKNN